MIKNNRVYGVIGIKAIRSNWNADFTGRPRTDHSGKVISTDKALKFAYRHQWVNEDEKVFSFKSLNENFNPRSLKEKYESMFLPLADTKQSQDVLTNLFSCVDVMNFGATFAESKFNYSITGAVQIHQGINVYADTAVETLDITAPFRNPNDSKSGEEKKQTTIGEMVLADRAHYLFNFSVNPQNYNEFQYLEQFEGYTVEAYNKFKEASRYCVTALNSNTKAGCDNELALFIELKENSKIYLPSLIDFISYIPGEGDELNKYNLSKLVEFLKDIKDEIDTIEIFYNPCTTAIDIEKLPKELMIKEFNLFTGKKL